MTPHANSLNSQASARSPHDRSIEDGASPDSLCLVKPFDEFAANEKARCNLPRHRWTPMPRASTNDSDGDASPGLHRVRQHHQLTTRPKNTLVELLPHTIAPVNIVTGDASLRDAHDPASTHAARLASSRRQPPYADDFHSLRKSRTPVWDCVASTTTCSLPFRPAKRRHPSLPRRLPSFRRKPESRSGARGMPTPPSGSPRRQTMDGSSASALRGSMLRTCVMSTVLSTNGSTIRTNR